MPRHLTTSVLAGALAGFGCLDEAGDTKQAPNAVDVLVD